MLYPMIISGFSVSINLIHFNKSSCSVMHESISMLGILSQSPNTKYRKICDFLPEELLVFKNIPTHIKDENHSRILTQFTHYLVIHMMAIEAIHGNFSK